MTESRRPRSTPSPEWERARLAYQELVRGVDPAATAIKRLDAVDLRPGGPGPARSGRRARAIVVSGPADLVELREIVEAATGVGTWPTTVGAPGEVRTARLDLHRSAPLLSLLLAMDGLIDDRSPWRTWRTTVDTLAGRVRKLRSITIEALIIRPVG